MTDITPDRRPHAATVHRTIVFAEDFTTMPGARYPSDGPHSGEEFRERHLLPALRTCPFGEVVIVLMENCTGFAPSFLEEAFGGTVRQLGPEPVEKKLRVITRDTDLSKTIRECVQDASCD